MKLLTGNTYPVNDQCLSLIQNAPISTGNNQNKPFRYCKECGYAASRYNPIYRNGQCRSCYQSQKQEEMGY